MEVTSITSGIGILDIFFISIFLVANVILGFISRNKCFDANETVFGRKSKFSDIVLMTSMCATMLNASLFIGDFQQIILKGLPILITSAIMYPAMYFIITIFLVPRITVTIFAYSWYEYIGKIYGKTIRIIFAICNLLLYAGNIATLFITMNISIQVIFNCSFGLSKIITLISALILICYSAFGGLKAVTITDVLQFIVFFSVFVFVALFLWVTSPTEVHTTFCSLFNGSNSKMNWSSCFGSWQITIATLSFWFARLIPDFPQSIYQRCYACKSLKAARKNMLLASIIFLIFSLILDFIALQIMSMNNNLEQDAIVPFLVSKLSLPGLKGLFCIAILALAISTADSELNACAIVLANDVLEPIKHCRVTSRLIRKLTFVIGAVSIGISLYATSIFDVFMTIVEIIAPIYGFSFIAIVLGMKTSKVVIWISMISGLGTIIIYHLLWADDYGLILGLLANLISLTIAHFVWKKFFKNEDDNDADYNYLDPINRLPNIEYDDDYESLWQYKSKTNEWIYDVKKKIERAEVEKYMDEIYKEFVDIAKGHVSEDRDIDRIFTNIMKKNGINVKVQEGKVIKIKEEI